MLLDILRSGYDTLQHELDQEKASALGRLGRRLESALAELAACPQAPDGGPEARHHLVAQAGYALWLFVVQREACGLNDSAQIMRRYGVPNEVRYHMGPLPMRSRADESTSPRM
jgi:hypothetical protein